MKTYTPAEVKLIEKFGLTVDEFGLFSRACNQTYQAIGHDLMADGEEMSRIDLMETVCDADYIRNYGEPTPVKKQRDRKEWEKQYNKFSDCITNHFGKPTFRAIAKIVFPYEKYGA